MRQLRPIFLGTALGLSFCASVFAQLDDRVLPAAQEGRQGAFSFTTFDTEADALNTKLPCQWVSEGARDGAGRFDLACTGGSWGSVKLLLDKSSKVGGGLSRVRLLWTEWPAGHPAAAENVIAQQFLQYVADRYISPKLAPEVMQSFWGGRARDWQKGDVRLAFDVTETANNRVHRLEIIGLATNLKLPGQAAQLPKTFLEGFGDIGNGVFAPFQPKETATPKTPEPQPIQPATPADIAPQPEPESLKKPVAAPAPTLVPEKATKPAAPTNFDLYNKAQEMTRSIEEKAFGKPLPPKAAPATEFVPPVKVVPTPAVSTAPAGVTQGEGLGNPSVAPTETPAQKAAQQSATPVTAPSTVAPWEQPAPTGQARPLPQLQYVPKAQPLENPAEVIQFQDEKSKL